VSHYDDTLLLLAQADAAAVRANEASMTEPHDPTAMLPGLVGALMSILAAQVHATLAVADAVNARKAESK
jgi:hypothetical protein